ncbi:MAG: PAS domain S-box protein [Hyphomicrobiales bacterium]|nr:PAS domain S-box protein [Hyphomicrobiales bacterium]
MTDASDPAPARDADDRPQSIPLVGDPAPRGRAAFVIEIAPLVVAGLIVALLAALVWLADRREREEAGEALIRDTLWVEQALRFQVEAGQEALDRLALDMTSARLSEEIVAARLRTIVGSHPEVGAVEWRDDLGVIRVAVPPDVDVERSGDGPPRPLARGFSEPRRIGAAAVADLTVPIFDHDVRVGRLTAHVHLDRLLALYVPWWISQNNHVTLVDKDGVELAHKSALAPLGGTARHTLSFDPPLPGVDLVLTAHSGGSTFLRNLLGAGVLVLGVVAVFALFGLTLHWRRRLAAERDLGEARALRRAMEESLTVGMRARDLEERIIYVNPAFCRMVGWEADELVGHLPPQPYWLPELVEETLARHQALGERRLEPLSFETRFRRRDGEIFDVRVYEAPLVDATGRHRGWMGSLVDVTEVKRAEERERLHAETLTRTGRLISLGEMASTISHELNQPLAAIASYASGCLHLLKSGRPNADLVGALEKLEAQARRAGRVIRRVHDFVRKREPEFARLDLAELVGAIAAFVALDARKAKVELATDLPVAPLPVLADRTLIEQVLVNLTRNGMEAMAATAPSARRLDVAVARRAGVDGDLAVITVADHGPGIAPDVAEKLFTPFFSTKPEGMGMGLAICRSIVELHRGRLEFAAREGGGTVFSVILPIDPEAAPS